MTEPVTMPTEGTYYFDESVRTADAVNIGFRAGRPLLATHLFTGGQWVRLSVERGGRMRHDPCEEPAGFARDGGDTAPGYPVVAITNQYEVDQGLESAKPAVLHADRPDPGPDRPVVPATVLPASQPPTDPVVSLVPDAPERVRVSPETTARPPKPKRTSGDTSATPLTPPDL